MKLGTEIGLPVLIFRPMSRSLYHSVCSKGKVFLFTGPVVVQRVGRGIALLFHDRGTRSG